MRTTCCRLLGIGLLLLFASSSADSKAELSRLFLSGGSLPRPVEVTDAGLLRASNPWFGTFLPQWNRAPHERVVPPPDGAPRYEITFYATFSPEKPPHVIYVAYYAYDPTTHRGYVYLPGHTSHGRPLDGHNDQWYDTNASTILRPDQDGRWNLADPAWCDQINAILARSEAQ